MAPDFRHRKNISHRSHGPGVMAPESWPRISDICGPVDPSHPTMILAYDAGLLLSALLRTLLGSRYSWWAGNTRFTKVSGKFLGAHTSHAVLTSLWPKMPCLFELAHYVPEKVLYEQSCIELPHLSTTAISVGPSGDIRSLYPYSMQNNAHLIRSGTTSSSRPYHSIMSANHLEDTYYSFPPKY